MKTWPKQILDKNLHIKILRQKIRNLELCNSNNNKHWISVWIKKMIIMEFICKFIHIWPDRDSDEVLTPKDFTLYDFQKYIMNNVKDEI